MIASPGLVEVSLRSLSAVRGVHCQGERPFLLVEDGRGRVFVDICWEIQPQVVETLHLQQDVVLQRNTQKAHTFIYLFFKCCPSLSLWILNWHMKIIHRGVEALTLEILSWHSDTEETIGKATISSTWWGAPAASAFSWSW